MLLNDPFLAHRLISDVIFVCIIFTYNIKLSFSIAIVFFDGPIVMTVSWAVSLKFAIA